ncbi:MAG: glycosyltransferase family 9 protein [Gammaproteobacteria bacterium]|nr:glycosyltransferase family 9 protein [Gammaproteobacteria bacterium]
MNDVAQGPLPRQFSKILVIRRDNIGDLLCTTPMLSALRRRYPTAHIAVLANDYNAPVLAGNPDVDKVYAYTKAKHSAASKLHARWCELKLYFEIRRAAYELVIHANPSPHPRTGRLARFLGAPYRLGVVSSDNGPRDAYFNIGIPARDVRGAHHVEKVFSLLAPLGVTGSPGPMTLKAADNASWQNTTPAPDHPARVIGVHLSSRKACNRWPIEAFSRLIESLLGAHLRVALFWAPGSEHDPRHPGDDEHARALAERFGHAVKPMPTRTLENLIHGLNQTDAVVCCDGGALHIASALGKPVVALFGCTDPRIWGPWRVEHRVLQGEGDAAGIQPSAVFEAVKSLFT